MSETAYIVIGIIVLLVLVLHFKSTPSKDFIRSVPEPEDSNPKPDINQLLQDGRKIEAIKLYRQIHGVDLKEAKEAVEELEQDESYKSI